ADEIPEEIFLQTPGLLGEAFDNLPENERKSELLSAIGTSGRYSLLSRDSKMKVNSINRLVQEVIVMQMTYAERSSWETKAMCAVGKIFPPPDYENWTACDRLIRHANVLNNLGMLSRSRGRFEEAERAYLRALSIYKGAAGDEDNPYLPNVLNN